MTHQTDSATQPPTSASPSMVDSGGSTAKLFKRTRHVSCVGPPPRCLEVCHVPSLRSALEATPAFSSICTHSMRRVHWRPSSPHLFHLHGRAGHRPTYWMSIGTCSWLRLPVLFRPGAPPHQTNRMDATPPEIWGSCAAGARGVGSRSSQAPRLRMQSPPPHATLITCSGPLDRAPGECRCQVAHGLLIL